MQLGINLGYWGAGMDADNLAVAQEADRLGYAVCWAAEAYGSDAATVLTWVAAQTERIDVGSAIFQIPARQPAMTAMTAATLDSLSGGRFRLGLGVSGPQVSEGWYGVKFDKPLARTREYVEIIRKAMTRERLSYEGEHWTLPLPGGPGKPIKLTVHPQREHIPLYIAAIGPKNLEQTGEIADGALLVFSSADHLEDTALKYLRTGREKAGKTMDGFEVSGPMFVVTGADHEAMAKGAAGVRQQFAFYGSTPAYRKVLDLHGWGDLQDDLNRMSKEGRWKEMGDLVTDEILEAFAVVAPLDRVAAGLKARWGDVLGRISFYAPYGTDPAQWTDIITELKS